MARPSLGLAVDVVRWSPDSGYPLPVPNENEIRVAAAALIRQYGNDALMVAKRMIRRYTKAGDSESAAEWQQITRALDRPQQA